MTSVRPRVAVTGVGMVTALGCNASVTLHRLMKGDAAIGELAGTIHRSSRPPQVAEVSEVCSETVHVVGELAAVRSDRFALLAAREAIKHAGLDGQTIELVLGASTGATREGIADAVVREDAWTMPLVARLARQPIGASGHQLTAELGGVATATVLCSACSSGALAIAVGAMRLEQGSAWPQLVGGSDSLNLLTLSGFESLGALSKVACRPFDEQHSGLSLGEGAGFLLLETEAMVTRRGGRVLAWLDGYAIGAEAHHLTHPEPEGRRTAAFMLEAMRRAGLEPRDVGYINAHGTATVANDEMESRALRLAFGSDANQPRVSSSKGQIGHTLAAAGAIEAAITVLSLLEQMAPPTIGLSQPAADCQLRHVMGSAEPVELRAALSNSFGFGGACAVLALRNEGRGGDGSASVLPSGESYVVSSIEPEPLLVTGLLTLGPAGILRGRANADWLTNEDGAEHRELPFEPLDQLVMERSRRFDRLTALTTLGCVELLADGEIPLPDSIAELDTAELPIGLVVGNSVGPVGRSADFVARILKRGARGANPAEFPHLLPSALSGNASIYAGLRGPVFNVSDSGPTIHSAMELSMRCIRSRLARAMLVGTTECREDVIVRAHQEGIDVGAYPALANDGSAWLLMEGRTSALSRARPAACEIAIQGRVSEVLAVGSMPPPPAANSLVLWGAAPDEQAQALIESWGWSQVPRRSSLPRRFDGWAYPGFVLVAAAALVAAGECSSVLVLTESRSGVHLALFRTHPV